MILEKLRVGRLGSNPRKRQVRIHCVIGAMLPSIRSAFGRPLGEQWMPSRPKKVQPLTIFTSSKTKVHTTKTLDTRFPRGCDHGPEAAGSSAAGRTAALACCRGRFYIVPMKALQ